MQYELLKLLRCLLTKTQLRFELITEFTKHYSGGPVNEIRDGLLFSETGFVFPVIDGVPRMLIEAICDYEGFLKKHLASYENTRNFVEKNYRGVLEYCSRKNEKKLNSNGLFLTSARKIKYRKKTYLGFRFFFMPKPAFV
jgi:uncharacterized protein YbaR (Trm112 family)